MRKNSYLNLFSLIIILFLFAFKSINSPNEFTLMESWQEKYRGYNATGSHVVALWSFDNKKNRGYDESGHGNSASSTSYNISESGKFGNSLKVDNQMLQPFVVKHNRSLTPSSDFSIEMWINPEKSLQKNKEEIILMGNLQYSSGYQFSLHTDSLDIYYLSVFLGYGGATTRLTSDIFKLTNNSWYHVAFTYDGQGSGKFYLNGKKIGEGFEKGVSQIRPSEKDLTIGSKLNSKTSGLDLLIDEVRLSNRELYYTPVDVEILSDRQVFLRMEENAIVKLRLTNISNKPLKNIKLEIGWGWAGLGSRFKYTQNIKDAFVGELLAGATYDVSVPINTKLRSDRYFLTIEYSDANSPEKYPLDNFLISIKDRKLPDEYPVILWGGGFGVLDEIKKIGFTHAFGASVDYGKIWRAGTAVLPGSEKLVRQTRKNFDNALDKGITIMANLYPAVSLDTIQRFKRVDRNGQYYENAHLNALYPEVQEYTYNVGASVAKAYGDLPAFGGALLHTERRGNSFPSYKEIDKVLYRNYSGREIPKSSTIALKRGDNYKNIKNFPHDRVIPESDSLYTYFKWYWKEGDGWNQVNDKLHKGLKSQLNNNRSDFWTFYDPAVRVAPVYGAGGLVDVISHWTYTYPDPLKIGLTTDELLCMAGGANHKQDVMSMTQIIWYRSQTAPTAEDKRKFEPKITALWEKTLPSTGYQLISISPAHLSEAFWIMISRPITGIMYHGWQSLVPDQYHSAYYNTNNEISLTLKELIKNVIQPLGPTLKSIPAVKSDIAFYQSFASQIYAGRGTWGWAGTWLGDSYLMFNYAGLQPDIVYDETITRDQLKNIKILVMMDCDVITESVKQVITDFQLRGGIIISDKELTPSIKPDIIIERFNRTGHAFNDKNHLMKLAEELLASLEKYNYKSYLSTSNMNLITYLRKFNDTDYIFLINDNREYGAYVGQHGLVMENGKPVKGKLFVNRADGYAYDLTSHRVLDNFIKENNSMSADIELNGGGGNLIMITQNKIDNIKMNGPDKLFPGQPATFRITVCDSTNKEIDAIIPIQFEVKDSEGRILEKSGYWKAQGGVLEITLDIAENDVRGVYQIKAKELASGKTVYFYPRLGAELKIEPTFEDKEKSDSFQPRG
jgi:hypothetical protein